MSQSSNNLAAYSWSIADLLRGDFKQSQYGRIVLPFIWLEATNAFRHLRRAGLRIGVADTLIAATALNYGLPVVTENAGHFGRLPGLTVLAY